MSLRQAFKSKFRQEKPEIDIMTAPTILQTYPSEEHLLEEMGDEVYILNLIILEVRKLL